MQEERTIQSEPDATPKEWYRQLVRGFKQLLPGAEVVDPSTVRAFLRYTMNRCPDAAHQFPIKIRITIGSMQIPGIDSEFPMTAYKTEDGDTHYAIHMVEIWPFKTCTTPDCRSDCVSDFVETLMTHKNK